MSDVLAPEDAATWASFLSVLEGTDLESALKRVSLTDSLLQTVIARTWQLLNEADLELLRRLATDRTRLCLTRLYRFLFRSTHTSLHVVTTNYDRLAEYAADAGEFAHYTGFTYGHVGYRDTLPRLSLSRGQTPVRTVNVWKVHGSLDWFKTGDGSLLRYPTTTSIPTGLRPAMVTPGIEKYRQTHLEPFRTVLAAADEALMSARAYLCIGYGFNDDHIQEKLVGRCQREAVHIVVLARTLTPAARAFLLGGRCQSFLALERAESGTRAYSPEAIDGELLDGINIWDLDQFLNHTI